MKRRNCLAALVVLLSPVVSFAQSAPQNCVNSNGYICNGATDPTTSVALGNMSGANGQYTTAIGTGAIVNPGDDYGTAIGAWAMVLAPDSTAIGTQSSATESSSLAVGYTANAAGDSSTAVGTFAYAQSNGSDAFGYGAYAGTSVPYFTGQQVDANGNPIFPSAGDLAVGNQAVANGINNTAIGEFATATGTNPCTDYTGLTCNPTTAATAVGNMATASGLASTALGAAAYAFGDYSTAIGEGAKVATGAINGTSLGRFALVQDSGTNSVSIGAWSVASEPNTVSVGDGSENDRRIVNMLPGFETTDAVNFGQLSGVAAFLGGGAGFDSAGNPISPMYVLSNPYTAGDYFTVGDAITALDKAISGVKSTPGPQGPVGPQGPAGKDATGGTGNDPLAVHYDNAKLDSVTLGRQPNSNDNQTANAVGGPVIVHNLAPGIAGTDAANVDQVQEALDSANTYTNIRATQVLNQANAYTDWRVGQLDGRIKRAIAIGTAQAQMVATYAGADPSSANRVAVGTGWEGGYGALAVGYQHVSVQSKHRITWNVGASISGGDGSVGGGVGFSW